MNPERVMQGALAFLLGFTLTIAFNLTVRADDPPTCMAFHSALNNVTEYEVPVRRMRKLKADEIEKVVAWYNAAEPPTDYKFDLVIYVEHENGAVGIMMGYSHNKTICVLRLLDADMKKELLALIGGEDV